MILGNHFEVTMMLEHECTQKLRVVLQVDGQDAEAKKSEENRITCTAFFAFDMLFFYEQGGIYHISHCPHCSKPLPQRLQDVREQEWRRLKAR